MRRPLREWLQLLGASVAGFAVTMVLIVLIEGRLTFSGFLLATFAGVFSLVAGWWIGHTSPLASRVALLSFMTGGLLSVLPPLLPLPPLAYFAVSMTLVLMFFGGLGHIVVHDWERIEAGKQSVFSRESRLMSSGLVMLIGWAFAFTFLVTLPRLLGVKLPIPYVVWDAVQLSGVILFGLGVILARKKKAELL